MKAGADGACLGGWRHPHTHRLRLICLVTFTPGSLRFPVPVPSAMQQVLDNAGAAPTSTGAKDIDLLFLRGIMESPTVGLNEHISRSATQTPESTVSAVKPSRRSKSRRFLKSNKPYPSGVEPVLSTHSQIHNL